MNVLIIDDEETPRNALKRAFEAFQGRTFDVKTAETSEEAAMEIAKCKFDVITVDIMLDKDSEEEIGIDLLKEGMILASCRDAVKIVVTAYPTFERCVKAMRLGAWDFIQKSPGYQQRAVQSAVERLDELEFTSKQEAEILGDWLPMNENFLRKQFSDEYIAILDKSVIAHGKTMIDLGIELAKSSKWRSKKPFILHIAKGEVHD